MTTRTATVRRRPARAPLLPEAAARFLKRRLAESGGILLAGVGIAALLALLLFGGAYQRFVPAEQPSAERCRYGRGAFRIFEMKRWLCLPADACRLTPGAAGMRSVERSVRR